VILVDTSVLMDFLRGEDNSAVQKLFEIIDRDIPFGISPIIFMEVLQGAATKRDFDILREYLGCQAFYDLKEGRESYARAAKMSLDLRREGMAVRSSNDCLIAQAAIDNDLYLLHNDVDFDRIKKVSPLKTWD